MKFKESHRQDILNVFADLGISKEHYSFQKRKGRIIISCGRTSTFSFFQTSDFDIDMLTKARIDTSHFEVKLNQDAVLIVSDWEGVLSQLNTWIKSIIPKD